MRRILVAATVLALVAGPAATQAVAHHHPKQVQGPKCGGKFQNDDTCSFRYKGGQLYVGGFVRGAGAPEGAATFRLEALSDTTGQRRVLLSCATPGSGACSAGGSYDAVESLRKGQRLFCTAEGLGRGRYECGTILTKRRG